MIAEAPLPACAPKATASRRKQMATVRAAVKLCSNATVTGVAFFDFEHGQAGVSGLAGESESSTTAHTSTRRRWRCGASVSRWPERTVRRQRVTLPPGTATVFARAAEHTAQRDPFARPRTPLRPRGTRSEARPRTGERSPGRYNSGRGTSAPSLRTRSSQARQLPALRRVRSSDEDAHSRAVGGERRLRASSDDHHGRRWAADVRPRPKGPRWHVGALVLRRLQQPNARLGRGVRAGVRTSSTRSIVRRPQGIASRVVWSTAIPERSSAACGRGLSLSRTTCAAAIAPSPTL